MSFYQNRKATNAQTRFRTVLDELNRLRAERIASEQNTTDFKTTNRLSQSRLKFHDPHYFAKKYRKEQVYLPREPDFNLLTLWLKMDHTGRYLKDSSGFAHHANLRGNPILKQGIDTGQGSSVYVNFNAATVFVDVPHNVKITAKDCTHFTISCRIYPRSLTNTEPDLDLDPKYRHICGKVDDSAGAYGYALAVSDRGELIMTVKYDNVFYSAATDPIIYPTTNTCMIPQPFEIAAQFDSLAQSADKINLFVDSVQYQGYPSKDLPIPDPSTDVNKQLHIGRNQLDTQNENGTVYYGWHGGIAEFRFWRNYLYTKDEVYYLYRNKQSINNIQKGRVARLGYFMTFANPVGIGGFHAKGFHKKGFHTVTE